MHIHICVYIYVWRPTDLDYPTDRLILTVQCICCVTLRFPLHVYYKDSMSVLNAPAGG